MMLYMECTNTASRIFLRICFACMCTTRGEWFTTPAPTLPLESMTSLNQFSKESLTTFLDNMVILSNQTSIVRIRVS